MKGYGILLIILGAGSFILPLLGIQFKIMMLFGSYQTIAAIAFMIIGTAILVASYTTQK